MSTADLEDKVFNYLCMPLNKMEEELLAKGIAMTWERSKNKCEITLRFEVGVNNGPGKRKDSKIPVNRGSIL